MPDFTWPCDLRIAHGGHEVIDITDLTPEQINALDYDDMRLFCPGVPAHPNTMIGRAQ